MNRIDRLSAILIQLQSKKIVKAQEIADRFEISLRTVYRDIRALEEAGIPIGAEAGIGYFLNSEFHLPPVMFTREEASAFLLADKLVAKLSDQKVSKAFEGALFKVKSVLKESEQEHLENLHAKVSVFSTDTWGQKNDNLFLLDIQSALANQQVLEIDYTAKYNKQQSKRLVEPISLCNYDKKWHLIAYCRLRNDYRDFRLDRINSLSILNEQFDEKQHLSLEEYFEQMSQDNNLHTIKLKVHQDIVGIISASKYWFGLVKETKGDTWHEMTFSNNNLELFAKWVISMIDKVQIVMPVELKTIIRNDLTRLQQHYK
ncbi:helix-turn-helix transcriptional regulator [Carboxylicivirga sp. N1Y90]|uniref:helix-turn-helix transcriptional regulator n=1 Tax=Carboxylicivirga fragile TaxID=3417571 RepID=UPI003D34F68F|nr:YafY family transcriptional regulator [Marinilabiliaceae bacterium N1Y90]